MPKFFLTVGQRYRREPHPDGLTPDGWVEIECLSIDDAHKIAFMNFGNQWANVYSEDNFDRTFYPLGCIREINTKTNTNEKQRT